jgi:hypothetical protein
MRQDIIIVAHVQIRQSSSEHFSSGNLTVSQPGRFHYSTNCHNIDGWYKHLFSSYFIQIQLVIIRRTNALRQRQLGPRRRHITQVVFN